MITLERMREIEPKLKHASDDEVAEIRERLYGLAQLAYDRWVDENGSKIPVGLRNSDEEK